jgi:hypothetical protein
MTLKEKFTEILYKQSQDDSECLRIRFENIDKVIDSQKDIADEFAIGFAVWCIKKRIDFFDSTEIGETYTIDGNVSKYKMNELLEIYKQGL